MFYKILFALFFLPNSCFCKSNISLKETIAFLSHKYGQLYGFIDDNNSIENFDYPGENRHKLSAISSRWLSYYKCQARQRLSLRYGRMTSRAIAAYAGSVARLQCDLCLSPEDGASWMIAELKQNLSFTSLEEKDTIVLERDGSISIYHVESSDAGVYRCDVKRSHGGHIYLEVLSDETHDYDIVKPLTSAKGPYPPPPLLVKETNLMLYNKYTRWSHCSACDRVGRKRRYGLCMVKYNNNTNDSLILPTNESDNSFIDELLKAFPEGVPCRSILLPNTIRDLPQVQDRANEIMIGLCKVPCPIESSSCTIHSRTIQPRHDVIFTPVGKPLTLRCPGTSLLDCPISWRVGNNHVHPQSLASTNRRVMVNARDHIVFYTVIIQDSNLYSCWESDNLAGTVRVIAWRGPLIKVHIILVLTNIIAGFILIAVRRRVERYA